MIDWIKLDEHEGSGAFWYSLPGEMNQLKFKKGDLITCKFNDGSIEKLPITFIYIPHKEVRNDIVYNTKFKLPCVLHRENSKNIFIRFINIDFIKNELVTMYLKK